jgi:hypothetical protein
MRKVAWGAAVVTVAYCGVYVFIYLARWQWERAMFMGFGFLAAEIVIATLVILRRLDAQHQERSRRDEVDPEVLAHIRNSAPKQQHFAWLDPRSGELNVFVTMLVASGVIVSGVAWLVEKIASNTSTKALEHRLAKRIRSLAPPDELVVDDGELLAEEQPYDPDPELRLLLRPQAERDGDGPWSG